jgi:hypothetical protein
MAQVEEQLDILDIADPKYTVEEATQILVDECGYDPQVARLEVLRSRKKGPISDRVVTLPDGTRAVRVI